jgi:8-oxo-dGTP pyrophosphatase MutT (NUDIX family)
MDKENLELLECNGEKSVNENVPGIPVQSMMELGISSFNMNNIKFLLVRRRHSLNFDEFISGRYNLENSKGIIYLFNQMTPEEINIIRKSSFDELWKFFWGSDRYNDISNKRYMESKEKFEKLKSNKNAENNLDSLLNASIQQYKTPEWGFPKGRKKRGEDDLECAKREFFEETGVNVDDINIIKEVRPITEDHRGTNGKQYRHIYYLAETLTKNVEPRILTISGEHTEIGEIGFFTLCEAMKLFRESDIEKEMILQRIINYYNERTIKKKVLKST